MVGYFKKCPRLVVNFPAKFLDDETDIHYEWVTVSLGNVLCTVPHLFPVVIKSPLFNTFLSLSVPSHYQQQQFVRG